jgi:hypothetical protein
LKDIASLPGSTRQSIHFEGFSRRWMDARVKPAHDAFFRRRRVRVRAQLSGRHDAGQTLQAFYRSALTS